MNHTILCFCRSLLHCTTDFSSWFVKRCNFSSLLAFTFRPWTLWAMVAFETPLKAVLCLIERKRLVLTSCMAFCTSSSWSAIDRPIIEGVVWSWRRRVTYRVKARKMAHQAVWLAKWPWPLVKKQQKKLFLRFLLYRKVWKKCVTMLSDSAEFADPESIETSWELKEM